MVCRNFFIVFSILLSQVSGKAYSQSTLSYSLHAAIIKPYTTHHALKKEVLYIQANKQIFLAGEPIAFKVYIAGAQDRKPFPETNNIYVDLYSASGEIVSQQVLYAEGGMAPGMILLASTQRPGSYTLRAYTAWSRNWTGDHSLLLPIEVLGQTGGSLAPAKIPEDLVLEVYAEGGTFIEDVATRFGLKLAGGNGLDDASGIRIKKNGIDFATLSVTAMGFASCYIKACIDDQLTAEWQNPSGKMGSVTFPKPLLKGVGLTVAAGAPGESLLVQVHTNKETVRELGEKKFYLLLHQRGTVKKLLWVSFVNRKLVLEQKFAASELGEGITHITLFGPDFKPIADRAVYLDVAASSPRLETRLERRQDSVTVEITTFNSAGQPLVANLGMTLLPAATRADGFRSSLYSRNHLEADIRGTIENPAYFFEGKETNRRKELDEALLVHGWKRYDWNAILNGQRQVLAYPFEQGFTVRGYIKDFMAGKQKATGELILSDPAHQLFLKAPVDSIGRFEFSKVFLQRPAQLTLFASNIKDLRRYRNITVDSISFYFNPARSFLPTFGKRQQATLPADLFVGAKLLENVTVKSRKRSRWSASYDVSTATERFYKFDETERIRYPTLKDYLRARYNVIIYESISPTGVSVYHLSFSPTNSINLTSDPVLVIDGAQISDLRMIERILVRDIESISVNTRGSNEVAFGSGGHIIIKSRSPLDEDETFQGSNVLKQWMMEGYSLPAAYYMPAYSMPTDSPGFGQYACLYWNPDIVTDSTGKARFTFVCPKGITGIEYIVEGWTPRGDIFYDRQRVSFSP